MKILSITNSYNTANLNHKTSTQPKNCSFKSVHRSIMKLWEDDNYDRNSIFYLLDKRAQNYDIKETDYSGYRSNAGYPVNPESFPNIKINSFRYIGNNNYKGGMTDAANYVEELKAKGINEFIVLCNPSETKIAEECKKFDVPWRNIYVPLAMNPATSEKYFNEDFNWGDFYKIVESLRNGNVFIGCESGNLRTQRFLHAVKILDPQSKLDLGTSADESYDYVLANWIYKGLTDRGMQLLNYTEEYKKSLLDDFAKRIPMNFRMHY